MVLGGARKRIVKKLAEKAKAEEERIIRNTINKLKEKGYSEEKIDEILLITSDGRTGYDKETGSFRRIKGGNSGDGESCTGIGKDTSTR